MRVFHSVVIREKHPSKRLRKQSTRQLSRQKANFFASHFASISSCSACLVGIIWSKNRVFDLENEPKCHINN